MIYTVQLMLKKMRVHANMDEGESSFSSDVEFSYLDDGHNFLIDTIIDERPEMLSTYFDLTLTGASEYFIPDSIPFNYETILMIEDVTESSNPTNTSVTSWFDRMNYLEDKMYTVYVPYSVRDQYIETPNKETSKTLRVWYTRRPVGMFYGKCGTGNTSTALTFPATPTAGQLIPEDDHYNGMIAYSANQTRRITDFVTATNVATVSPAWGTTPTDSTTVIEVISSLPERAHYLIPMLGAQRIRVANDDPDDQLNRLITVGIDKIVKRLKRPTIQGPELFRKVSRAR